MKRIIFWCITLALIFSAPAHAYLRMHGAQTRQWEWAKAAQRYVPLPDARLVIVDGGPKYIAPFLAVPFDDSMKTQQGLFLHELGHAYDDSSMTPARREAFKLAIRTTCKWWAKHCVTARWVSGPGVTVNIPPGEMFAEEYAACALGLTQRGYQDAGYNTYGWVPPQGVSDDTLCALIRG